MLFNIPSLPPPRNRSCRNLGSPTLSGPLTEKLFRTHGRFLILVFKVVIPAIKPNIFVGALCPLFLSSSIGLVAQTVQTLFKFSSNNTSSKWTYINVGNVFLILSLFTVGLVKVLLFSPSCGTVSD